ncbi:hypothetical protein HDV00_009467 [Rhizophlyctis rosea]|nr:hypothetical protein HDV00_009467 [Rhizophlyctis rosea]
MTSGIGNGATSIPASDPGGSSPLPRHKRRHAFSSASETSAQNAVVSISAQALATAGIAPSATGSNARLSSIPQSQSPTTAKNKSFSPTGSVGRRFASGSVSDAASQAQARRATVSSGSSPSASQSNLSMSSRSRHQRSRSNEGEKETKRHQKSHSTEREKETKKGPTAVWAAQSDGVDIAKVLEMANTASIPARIFDESVNNKNSSSSSSDDTEDSVATIEWPRIPLPTSVQLISDPDPLVTSSPPPAPSPQLNPQSIPPPIITTSPSPEPSTSTQPSQPPRPVRKPIPRSSSFTTFPNRYLSRRSSPADSPVHSTNHSRETSNETGSEVPLQPSKSILAMAVQAAAASPPDNLIEKRRKGSFVSSGSMERRGSGGGRGGSGGGAGGPQQHDSINDIVAEMNVQTKRIDRGGSLKLVKQRSLSMSSGGGGLGVPAGPGQGSSQTSLGMKDGGPRTSVTSQASLTPGLSSAGRRASSPNIADLDQATFRRNRRLSADSASDLRPSMDDIAVLNDLHIAAVQRAAATASVGASSQGPRFRTSAEGFKLATKGLLAATSPGVIKNLLPSPTKDRNFEGGIEDIVDVNPKELARQLALIDSDLFRSIGRHELASLAWSTADKHQKAPNIVGVTAHFNQIALWITQEILDSPKIKRRFQLICYFISVAKYCHDFNNFNGLRSVAAGLQSTPVHRLERTWAMVGRRERAVFEKLADLMSPMNNSEAYRNKLAGCKPPCVPYLGTWLSDLTFLNECLKKERGDPARAQQVVDREGQIEALLDEIARYQLTSTYPFEPIPGIQDTIKRFQYSPELHSAMEEEQYRQSLVLEPRKADMGSTATLSPASALELRGGRGGPGGSIVELRSRSRASGPGSTLDLRRDNNARGQVHQDIGSRDDVAEMGVGPKFGIMSVGRASGGKRASSIVDIITPSGSRRGSRRSSLAAVGVGSNADVLGSTTSMFSVEGSEWEDGGVPPEVRSMTVPSRFGQPKKGGRLGMHRRSKSSSASQKKSDADMGVLDDGTQREDFGWGTEQRRASGSGRPGLRRSFSTTGDALKHTRKMLGQEDSDEIAAECSEEELETFRALFLNCADMKEGSYHEASDGSIAKARPALRRGTSASVVPMRPVSESVGSRRLSATTFVPPETISTKRDTISTTTPTSSTPPPMVKLQGYLTRKDETDETGARAKNRKWIAFWVRLEGTNLTFYNDSDFSSSDAGGESVSPTVGTAVKPKKRFLPFGNRSRSQSMEQSGPDTPFTNKSLPRSSAPLPPLPTGESPMTLENRRSMMNPRRSGIGVILLESINSGSGSGSGSGSMSGSGDILSSRGSPLVSQVGERESPGPGTPVMDSRRAFTAPRKSGAGGLGREGSGSGSGSVVGSGDLGGSPEDARGSMVMGSPKLGRESLSLSRKGSRVRWSMLSIGSRGESMASGMDDARKVWVMIQFGLLCDARF